MPDTTFDAFIAAAWDEHGDHPQRTADRLAASVGRVQEPAHVRPVARLVAHVYGEHLGQWSEGIALLQSIRSAPGFDGSEVATEAIDQSVATLQYAGGDTSVLAAMPDAARALVLAGAAAIFTGRNAFDAAIDAYDQAIAIASRGVPDGAPAIRALAIAGNNLAAALEDQADATAAQRQAMVRAAEGGLLFWKRAGTWLEEERAEYRLARSLLRAGQAGDAMQAARRCVAVCERNGAPAFELFFGEAVLALACRACGDEPAFVSHRGRALGHWAQVPEDERRWCERERGELG